MNHPARIIFATAVLVASFFGAQAAPLARPVVLTGEVQALGSQAVIVPFSTNSPVSIRFYLPDGVRVEKGEKVLSIDAGSMQAISAIEQQLTAAKARAEKDAANLRVALIEAQIALSNAQAAQRNAEIDAKIPKQYISALDFDRYQNEAKRTVADVEQKRAAVAAAQTQYENIQRDARLEQEKLGIELAYSQTQSTRSEVYASLDGVLLHGYSDWRGRRVDEGESVMPGSVAGTIVAGTQREVVAFALEADRTYLNPGDAVELVFDAQPEQRRKATISSISASPEARAQWGDGRYFRITIALTEAWAASLMPGQSVRVQPWQEGGQTVAATTAPAVIEIDGEISARVKSSVAPPAIKEIWNYTLTMLAPDGSTVNPGQPVAMFDTRQVEDNLAEKRSLLDQVIKQLDKLALDHAQAEKQSAIDVEQAKSELERAERKASQPAELIKRVDYDKLVIARDSAKALYAFAQQKSQAQAHARDAERREQEVQRAMNSSEIAELEAALTQMKVTPKNPGIVSHGQSFSGEKFAVGSQVFQGLAVATVSDPSTLRIEASVPEAEARFLKAGQRARVRYGSSGASIDATVVSLGKLFRRKGRTQPTIVQDVFLDFMSKDLPRELRPGLQVRISIALPAGSAAPEKLTAASEGKP